MSTIVLLKACCAVREGHLDDGRASFDELRRRYDRGLAGADDLAMLAAVLGDWPAAITWLTEACVQRAPFLGYVDAGDGAAASGRRLPRSAAPPRLPRGFTAPCVR